MKKVFLLMMVGLAGFAWSDLTIHVPFDNREGARIAAATEGVRYSAAWESADARAKAEVAVNGVVLTNAAGSGAVAWTPTANGTYMLTHAVKVDGVQVGETLSATFVAEGLAPENPVITPASGMTFASSLTVSMSCPTAGATIRYTTDGSEPTAASPVYKRFKIYGKTTVRARAFDADGQMSEVTTAEYALGRCPEPEIVSAGGTTFLHVGNGVTIRYDGTEGVVHYTLDGSEPTAASPVYTGRFTVDETVVVKAKAFSDAYFDSAVVTATLTREWETVATPVIAAATSFTGSETKVVITCATPDATIRYTMDGREPNSHSSAYAGALWVDRSCTVRAIALKADCLASAVASFEIAKEWTIGDTMGAPDHLFATGGDVAFFRTADASAPGGESMRSGAIADSAQYGAYSRSVLSTTVQGPGTLRFRWRASCEADDEYEWDHAELSVDGVTVARINGVSDWQDVTHVVSGAGEHAVAWTYLKDDAEADGEDCVWVTGFSWTSDEPWTHASDVAVPYAWIREHLPHTADEPAAYEAALAETAANGHDTVKACFVAGLDPSDPTSELKVAVQVADGEVRLSWTPDLNSNAVTRIYTLWGRAALDRGDWETPVKPWHQFFRVGVAMPTGADGETTAVSGEGFVPEPPPLGGVQLWEGGPYWAECNVGATKPEDYGYYFWWGDTVGYRRNAANDGWVSVKDGSAFSFVYRNCPTYDKSNSQLHAAGYSDSTGNLVAAHDAATAHLGAPWRMPTDAEFSALINNCDTQWTTRNGVRGRLVKGRGAYASKSIFLPAAGCGLDSSLYVTGSDGYYWPSTPDSDYSYRAWYLRFGSGYFYRDRSGRCDGQSVRPVRGFAR